MKEQVTAKFPRFKGAEKKKEISFCFSRSTKSYPLSTHLSPVARDFFFFAGEGSGSTPKYTHPLKKKIKTHTRRSLFSFDRLFFVACASIKHKQRFFSTSSNSKVFRPSHGDTPRPTRVYMPKHGRGACSFIDAAENKIASTESVAKQ